MDAGARALLEFTVGGRPSRFMRHAADWERLYRFIEHIAACAPADRPSEEELAAELVRALPRREEWVDEILTVYRHGLALLDRRDG